MDAKIAEAREVVEMGELLRYLRVAVHLFRDAAENDQREFSFRARMGDRAIEQLEHMFLIRLRQFRTMIDLEPAK